MPAAAAQPGVALHHQISSVMRGAILTGRYRSGDLLPSEPALMRSFAVSRGTVRRALQTLQQQGWVDRLQGIGTRVSARLEAEPRLFHGQLRDSPAVLEASTIRLLDVRRDPDPAGDVRVERLRAQGECPLWLTSASLPNAVAHGFTDQDFATSSFAVLLARSGQRVARSLEEIGAVSADPALAALLEVPVGSPLIEYRRTLEAADGRRLCSHVNLIPPERHRVRLALVADELAGLSDGEVPDGAEYRQVAPMETSNDG